MRVDGRVADTLVAKLVLQIQALKTGAGTSCDLDMDSATAWSATSTTAWLLAS